MVFSLFFLGLAAAAEPTEYWSPELSELGAEALIAGEFDGAAGLDVIASYREGDALGLAVLLSGSGETWTLTPELPISALKLRVAQWDADAEEEVLLGMPEHSSAGHEVGAVWVLDFSGVTTAPTTLESLQTFSVLGDEQDSAFGTDVQAVDCNTNSGPELLVSAPNARNGGKVVAIASSGDPVALAQWSPSRKQGVFGVALGSLSTEQGPLLAVASCASSTGNCNGDGELYVLPISNCESTEFVEEGDALAGSLSARPKHLIELLEGSASEHPAILWSAAGVKSVLALGSGAQLATVATQNDQGAFVQSSDDAVQNWMSSSGSVWQVSGALGSALGADPSHVVHQVDGVDLGLNLALAGDVDADGCGDILASASDGEHLYLLSGCASENPDTGDTGDTGNPDTGDTSDTGNPDTGDTSKPDTGDSNSPDTGEEPCQESFGWTCATASPVFGWNGLALLSIVFFWTSRRRQTE